MSTCNNCIHYSACLWNGEYTPTPCRHFKDKADMVEVVRCRDCKHLTVINNGSAYARCEKTGYVFWSFRTDTREHFCAYGERREG